ncbi:prolipoprotein diacylglyceryl transferase [Chitinophaga polysaccharea]|uniref:prolipoprotein diacylglyceryl transferase n=1 Tax=Chitinophaga TaxID=79328 RepID=UPI001455D07D|nr:MULTISPECIES: prolipoprotein diacylglyceryl transferase family protein [Chitinophaga]NLR62014.1 prolipoprotein diacylglyceryl transferase [Chitinophaga polysaccharea]NLU94563.1 prolipoprotein diacylglyceryl transferase [Chitinophaga sp. Ak27]
MQFPVYIHFFSVQLPLHAVTETLGMFIGFRYFLYLRKQQGDQVNQPNRLWAIIGAIFGALFGSRLLGALENPPGLLQAGNMLLYIYQSKTIVGGLLGGLIGVELVKKVIGERQSTGDLFVYPLMLAMIIGRIGCFSMGIYEETYGIPTSLPWGMKLGDGIYRHPVSLYEIIFLLVMWGLLIMINRRYTLVSGATFKLFMIGYLLFRLLLDFIKPGYRYVFGLGSIQLACLAGLLYYLPNIVFPSRLIQKQYA